MLASRTFTDIPTLAFRHPLVGPPRIGFHGGPVIFDGEHQRLRHRRYSQPVDWFDGYEAVIERLAGDYVYGGPAYDHFGHVMSEMVHRLLPSQAPLAGRKLLLVSTVGDPVFRTAYDLPPFMQECLGFFGIAPEQVTILNEDRVVERLFIAQQGSDFGGGPLPEYLDMLAGFTERLLAKAADRGHEKLHEKVYVSRSALTGGGGFLGESYFEQVLETAGFFIARPETMTLLEQMRLYRQAKVLVFPEGSACHGIELLGPRSLGIVVLLARREDHLDIFSKVMMPRSRQFVVLRPLPGTTSIFRTWKHVTLGYIAVYQLFAALRDCGFPVSVPFNQSKYQQACESDFNKHVAHYTALCPDQIDPDLVAAASAHFISR